jgi:hypothetical protein
MNQFLHKTTVQRSQISVFLLHLLLLVVEYAIIIDEIEVRRTNKEALFAAFLIEMKLYVFFVLFLLIKLVQKKQIRLGKGLIPKIILIQVLFQSIPFQTHQIV